MTLLKLPLRSLGPLATLACELLALLSLYLAPELGHGIFWIPLGIGLLAFALRLRLDDRIVIVLVTAALIVAVALLPPEASAGAMLVQPLIPVHSLLWLAREERTYRYWRLSLAFLGIVLAAILAPEAHMFVLIFLFVILASLALSFGFIENHFRVRDPEALARPVRPAFLGTIVALACGIFLSSLLIFPILPRSNWSGDGGRDTSVDYTESVSFRSAKLFWGAQDSRPVIWVFRASERPWGELLPGGLLRGRVHGRFNGYEWVQGAGRKALPKHSSPADKQGEGLELVRLPLPTAILPVPYGTKRVEVHSLEPAVLSGAEEWLVGESAGKRVNYRVVGGGAALRAVEGDEVRPEHLEVDRKTFGSLASLAEQIGQGASDESEKVKRVARYFRESGFVAKLASTEGATGRKHPVNAFLFETRSGHCELFATAGALLLRSMGVPTRLAIGFRASSQGRGKVLTVHNSDAHAWVETWQRGRGWVPADFTPVTPTSASWMARMFEELSDLVGAYWNRYILGYEIDGFSWEAFLKPVLAAFALFLLAFAAHRWAGRRGRHAGCRDHLALVMLEFEENLVHKVGMFPDQAWEKLPGAAEWRRSYLNLRFGRAEPERDEVDSLRMIAREIIREAARVQGTAA